MKKELKPWLASKEKKLSEVIHVRLSRSLREQFTAVIGNADYSAEIRHLIEQRIKENGSR